MTATTAELQQRIAALEADNQQLKLQLADAERRAAAAQQPSTAHASADSPKGKSTVSSDGVALPLSYVLPTVSSDQSALVADSPYVQHNCDILQQRVQSLSTYVSTLSTQSQSLYTSINAVTTHLQSLITTVDTAARKQLYALEYELLNNKDMLATTNISASNYTAADSTVLQPGEECTLTHASTLLSSLLSTYIHLNSTMKSSIQTLMVEQLQTVKAEYTACDTLSQQSSRRLSEYETLLNKKLSVRLSDSETQQQRNNSNPVERMKTSMLDKWKARKNKPSTELALNTESVDSNNSSSSNELDAQLSHAKQQYTTTRLAYIHQLNHCTTISRYSTIELILSLCHLLAVNCRDFEQSLQHIAHEAGGLGTSLRLQRSTALSLLQTQQSKQQEILQSQVAALASPTNLLSPSQPPPPSYAIPTRSISAKRSTSEANASDAALRQASFKQLSLNQSLEQFGYLRKLSSQHSTLQLHQQWKRRYFMLRYSAADHTYHLYYIRDKNSIHQYQHVVNLMISHIKPHSAQASDLPFTFDIHSPNKRIYTLQAETAAECQEWIDKLTAATELAVEESAHSPQQKPASSLAGGAAKPSISNSDAMKQVQVLNPTCADCGSTTAEWSSLSLGIVICIECSGIHRSLGVEKSKVKSLQLDSWQPEWVQLLLLVGNDLSNAIYEAVPGTTDKPTADSARSQKEQYIQQKYIQHQYVSATDLVRTLLVPLDLQDHTYTIDLQKLLTAIQESNIKPLIYYVAILQVDVNLLLADVMQLVVTASPNAPIAIQVDRNHTTAASSKFTPSQTLLHLAAAADAVVLIEYLLLHNGDRYQTDVDGDDVEAIATKHQSVKCLDRLKRSGQRTDGSSS